MLIEVLSSFHMSVEKKQHFGFNSQTDDIASQTETTTVSRSLRKGNLPDLQKCILLDCWNQHTKTLLKKVSLDVAQFQLLIDLLCKQMLVLFQMFFCFSFSIFIYAFDLLLNYLSLEFSKYLSNLVF